MKDIVLYYAPDNASLIVRIVLEELQLPYTAVLVDRAKQEQSSDSYLSLNPTGLIPVCIVDGQTITETAAILQFIAEQSRTAMAVAADDPSRPQFLRWLFFMANTIHSDLRQVFYAEKYVGDDVEQQVSYRKIVRQRLQRHLGILDAEYRRADTIYLFGAEPCVIDIYLALGMRWLQLYPVIDRGVFQPADFPSILKMVTALQSRPAVIAACAAEGISGEFFSAAADARPDVGSAL